MSMASLALSSPSDRGGDQEPPTGIGLTTGRGPTTGTGVLTGTGLTTGIGWTTGTGSGARGGAVSAGTVSRLAHQGHFTVLPTHSSLTWSGFPQLLHFME